MFDDECSVCSLDVRDARLGAVKKSTRYRQATAEGGNSVNLSETLVTRNV